MQEVESAINVDPKCYNTKSLKISDRCGISIWK